MQKSRKTVLGILCGILLCLITGCSGAVSNTTQDSFTLDDLERCNVVDAVFEKYSSVRIQSMFYDFALSDTERGDIPETAVMVKGADGISLYFDVGDWLKYAIEGRNVYQELSDECIIMAFFDDGYYEKEYLPVITKWVSYIPTDGEKLISVSVEDGVRKLVTNMKTSDNVEYFETWGIPEGTIECNYYLDAKSGLLLREIDYLITDDGNSTLLSETELQYGEDDDFTPPEFVARCKDMTETRTVHYVRNPGTDEEKTFTFTLPKGISLSPETMEAYEYYEDSECTVLYEEETGEYPDELTVYMKRIDNESA